MAERGSGPSPHPSDGFSLGYPDDVFAIRLPQGTPMHLHGCLLAVVALAFARPLPSNLAFDPDEGTVLKRTFTYATEVALDDMTVTFDGADMTAMIGAVDIETTNEQVFAVTDEVVSTSDGKILELHRTFDQVSGSGEFSMDVAGNSQSEEVSASSELEGETVVFSWNDDEGAYDIRAREDSDVDEELLEGIDFVMDLSAFLPDGDVDEGDQWSVPTGDLGVLTWPGGDLGLLPDNMEEVDGFDQEMIQDFIRDSQERANEVIQEALEGEVTATFVGVQERDGLELGLIDVELDLELDVDMADFAEELLDRILSDLELPTEVEVSIGLMQVGATLEGGGQVLWHVDGQHGRSLSMEVDYDFELEAEVSFAAEGEGGDAGLTVEGSGTAELEILIE